VQWLCWDESYLSWTPFHLKYHDHPLPDDSSHPTTHHLTLHNICSWYSVA
jgi:hypothetical protein